VIGAEPHERTPARTTQRNGARERLLSTKAGDVELRIPKLRKGSFRTIPVPDFVVEAIRRHQRDYAQGPLGLLFTNDRGEPIRRNRFSEIWRRAVRDADLRPGLRFHDLRHFYASLLIHHGESVKTVQSRLGHASATETLDIYGHLWPDSEERTRAAVDLVLGPSSLTEAPTH
jgi:integrase